MELWSAEIKELEKLYDSIRDQLPDLTKELGQLILFDDPNVILLYSRRCLEVIITDLCECELKRDRGTEPLKGIIDKLNKEKKIPAHIASSMYGLNELSTFGTHPKDFDPEQIKPVLINLDIVIKWYLKHMETQTIIKIKEEEWKPQVSFVGDRAEDERLVKEKPARAQKIKFVISITLIALLIIAGIIAYPKIFKRDTFEQLRSSGERISVAIMPFQNMTNDTTWNIWQDGIQENLITYLSGFPEELKVRQTESINNLIQSKGYTNYASITPNIAKTISQKLDAAIYISGSIQQAGSKLRLNAKLIDTNTETVLKSFEIDGIYNEEIIFEITDSLRKRITDFLIISLLKEEVIPYRQSSITTNSVEAYRYNINADKAGNDIPTRLDLYFKALSVDSNFFFVIRRIAQCYEYIGLYEQAKEWCLKAYDKIDQMPLGLKLRTYRLYAAFFETPYEEIKYLKQLIDLDDQDVGTYLNLGGIYNELYQFDKAIPVYKKVLKIYKKSGIEQRVGAYTGLGYAYHKTDQQRIEKKLYKKAEHFFSDAPELIYRQAVLAISEGKTRDAKDYIEKYISLRKESLSSEMNIATNLAGMYSESEVLDKAEEYYRQALSLNPENPDRLNNLAYFLIDRERNVNEGMVLIDKVLELRPDNYSYLYTKGWGLFKQGKSQEALEILQKSWDIRREKAVYNHTAWLHLEAAKKAVARQKNN